jgi:hypothetical protein
LHDASFPEDRLELKTLFLRHRGIFVEVWKITKVIKFQYHPPAPGQTLPSFSFEDKKELSEDEKRTREYDALAFRIVGAVAVPTLIAYAAYSREYKCLYGRRIVG